MTATLGMVTCEDFPDLSPDDQLLIEPLRRRGIEARPVRWDAGGDWDRFDALVIRSTWDYFERPVEFAEWLDEREKSGPRLWNAPQVLRWNMRKDYLRELEAAGVPTVETDWVARGSSVSLEDVLDQHGWRDAVVKPTVSGGAWNTWPVRDGKPDAEPGAWDRLVAEHDVMVQPFLPQIENEGEWSVMFFNGRYNATVLKRPAPGDYRVQERHGGTTEALDPPPGFIEQAARAAEQAPGDLLYVRVDGVRDGDRLVLIELEALEPYLFFEATPGSEERFADALAERLR